MEKQIKNLLKNSMLFTFIDLYRQNKELKIWKEKDYPIPPPQSYKQKVIKEYAKKYNIKNFVETGTYLGQTVWSTRYFFKKIYSIELAEELFKRAKERFTKFKNITILKGDSGVVLPEILRGINESTIFWLDGHYSAGETAKGEKDTPILQELTSIFKHKIKNHIIIIDDARYFTGENDYPSIEYLKKFVLEHKKDAEIEIEHDLIRIV